MQFGMWDWEQTLTLFLGNSKASHTQRQIYVFKKMFSHEQVSLKLYHRYWISENSFV